MYFLERVIVRLQLKTILKIKTVKMNRQSLLMDLTKNKKKTVQDEETLKNIKKVQRTAKENLIIKIVGEAFP